MIQNKTSALMTLALMTLAPKIPAPKIPALKASILKTSAPMIRVTTRRLGHVCDTTT